MHCSDSPLAIDIIVPDSKVLRSGGRKRLRTSPVEELGQEHGAVVHHWTEFKNYALNREKRCAFITKMSFVRIIL